MRRITCFITVLTLLILLFGCSKGGDSESEEYIAYISANRDSDYVRMFEDLSIGNLFDFHLKQLKADQAWVNISVEGYYQGKPVEPFPLISLVYGRSPEGAVEEGPVRIGFIRSNQGMPSLFIKTSSVGMLPQSIEHPMMTAGAGSIWDYVIGEEPIGLKDGETKLLGVHRRFEANQPMQLHHLKQDSGAIQKMIEEDMAVLLFKIKVEGD